MTSSLVRSRRSRRRSRWSPSTAARPTAPRRRTWFDTFDWRLYRAGLILEYIAAHRGGELCLTSADPASQSTTPTTAEIAQPVTGWQASRPHGPQDLPDGPIAARVASLVPPRVLLPAVTVATTTAVSRLLNEDGKIVARLLIERPVITGLTALAPRLTITEVRGYPGQARRAARIVADVPGALPATDPVFADALRALGRRPGDYSNKVDAKITAGMPAPEAAAIILLRLLDTIEANIPGTLRDLDTEFLHDLRVSVRRSRSALKLFGDVLTTSGAKNNAKKVPRTPA